MKTRIAVLLGLMVPFAACRDNITDPTALRPASPVHVRSAAVRPIPEQYIIVLDRSTANVLAVAPQLAAQYGGTLGYVYTAALKGFSARLTAEAAAALRNVPGVQLVEQDQEVHAIETQTGATWGLDRIDQVNLPLSTTYNFNARGAGVNVYIIDTGIRFTHTDLGGRASLGVDEIGDGQNGNDCNGHGTHVSGTVGGTTWGVAKDVKLFAVRVLNCGGSGTFAGVIAGVDWVTANHISPAVANMSLGGGFSSAVNQAVTNSINSGVTYAIAAGNGDAFGPVDACSTSPASTPAALTVGATTITDTEASFSNYGTCVDILAPGVSITSSWNGTDTDILTISGTSMATPHVAGASALYLSTNPTATPAQVATALIGNSSANKIALHIFSQAFGTPNRLLYMGFIGPPPAPPAPPTAPSVLTAKSTGTSQINLAWADNSTDETSFKIERCTGVGCIDFVQIATVGANVTAFANTGLSASTTYTYQVRASNAGGDSKYSNIAAATTDAPPPPPNAPSALSATAESQSQINLAWTDNSADEASFKIERCVGAGCVNFVQIASVGANVTTFSNTGLAATTTYSYRVRASNVGGDSPYSDPATATTQAPPQNTAPVARYTWSCTDRSCRFDGTSSTDDKAVTVFNWDFGDGTTGAGATVSKRYNNRGTFNVTLTVRDTEGLTNAITCAVTAAKNATRSGSCPPAP